MSVARCVHVMEWVSRYISIETENAPLNRWLEENEDCDDREEGEEENIIRKFMRGVQEVDVCLPQVDRVEDFCVGKSLDSLRSGKGEAAVHKAAWLDERICYGVRSDTEPLTASGLYRMLKKPVSFSNTEILCRPTSGNLTTIISAFGSRSHN